MVSHIDCSGNAAVAETVFKAQFKFGRSRGAVLLMMKPITFKLEGVDNLLKPGYYDHLRDKYFITEIVMCTSYAMYLSSTSLF